MKNKFLLTLLPLIALVSPMSTSVSPLIKDKDNTTPDVALEESQINEFLKTFKSTLHITTTANIYGDNFTYDDYVSTNARTSIISYFNTSLFESYVTSDFLGSSYELYLDLSNEVKERALLDETDASVPFKGNFSSPFLSLANLKATNFNNYFSIKATEKGFIATAKNVTYGLLTNPLSKFYLDLETFFWEESSLEIIVSDLEFTLNEEGVCTGYSFNEIKRDAYGGYQSSFNAKVEKVSSVPTLEKHTSLMTSEQLNEFNTKVSSFQNKLKNGNFTQTIEFVGTAVKYDNFYAFNNINNTLPNMYLSNVALNDASKGKTYIGVVSEAGAYYPYAFSPIAREYSPVTKLVFPSLEEFLPNYSNISGDFFIKEGDTYTFDLSSFRYNDIPFSEKILSSLYSGFDPLVIYGGNYIDYTTYTYNFKKLVYEFDSNDNLVVTLSFKTDVGNLVSRSTFSKFNETDLAKEPTLNEVVPYIQELYN